MKFETYVPKIVLDHQIFIKICVKMHAHSARGVNTRAHISSRVICHDLLANYTDLLWNLHCGAPSAPKILDPWRSPSVTGRVKCSRLNYGQSIIVPRIIFRESILIEVMSNYDVSCKSWEVWNAPHLENPNIWHHFSENIPQTGSAPFLAKTHCFVIKDARTSFPPNIKEQTLIAGNMVWNIGPDLTHFMMQENLNELDKNTYKIKWL